MHPFTCSALVTLCLLTPAFVQAQGVPLRDDARLAASNDKAGWRVPAICGGRLTWRLPDASPPPETTATCVAVDRLVPKTRLSSRAGAQSGAPSRERSRTRIILGAMVGATGGFFAGGYLGSAIDGECGGCDDPGLMGALIGAPIGAVTGGILGGLYLF